MSKGIKQKRQKIASEFRAHALNEDTAVFYVAVPHYAGPVESAGIINTSDFAAVLRALCEDVAEVHNYGNCAHCDRIALAIRAAHDAFLTTFGADHGSCADTKQ